MLKGRQKRGRFLALMGVVLVVAALLSFSSSVWATPAQKHAQQQSVPPVKTADKSVVSPGEQVVFEITFTAGPDTWYGVTVTDDIDPYLRIDSVWTSHGSAGWAGQLVTVNVGNITAGTTVTIRIRCTVRDTVPGGHEIVNIGIVFVVDPELVFRPRTTIDVEDEFIPEAGSLLLLGSGLAGLAGYARLRWSRYRGESSGFRA